MCNYSIQRIEILTSTGGVANRRPEMFDKNYSEKFRKIYKETATMALFLVKLQSSEKCNSNEN